MKVTPLLKGLILASSTLVISNVSATKAESNLVANNYDFRIGVQVLDDAGRDPGRVEYTGYLTSGSVTQTDWVTDRDAYDPDAIKLHLSVLKGVPNNKDFRLAIQAADKRGNGDFGYWQYTPWASEGGGWSGFAFDADRYDPDAVRLKIETRNWQVPAALQDFRIGLRVADKKGSDIGESTFTPWASQGGGWTDLAVDSDSYDFDGWEVKLEVRSY
ncbi:hypothetical protein ACFOEE_18545 [Pseudoalteromonas fenneropenaei]|uniref:Uncharacterized protein n=1 Tax=Pseudoalteromonas fenneropenaei TaxID=1737459 RepID=A0ABV7CPQ8_9GAMM